MDDLISRKTLIDRLDDFNRWCRDGRLQGSLFAVDVIKDMPSAQPERKRGEWVPYLPEGLRYKCSECESRYETPWHFCPNCGADMKGEDNETD